ncbi:hypothetical protein STEG23_015861, partial [Scotinomys teguina]
PILKYADMLGNQHNRSDNGKSLRFLWQECFGGYSPTAKRDDCSPLCMVVMEPSGGHQIPWKWS